MNKIKLIIKREYLTRVKKKSFILMTLFGPLLMAGLMVVPIWLATKSKDTQVIEIVDETGAFGGQFENTEELKFEYAATNIKKAKEEFYDTKYTSILHITSTDKKSVASIYYKKQPGISTVSNIENKIEDGIRNIELKKQFSISKKQLESVEPSVKVETISIDAKGMEEEKNVGISSALAFGGAFMIYFFIFMYGVQIMRGVIEEKTSRIVEIIISSVKPFELMMGKIVGIALVGLTQFLLWTIITGAIYMVVMGVFLGNNLEEISQAGSMFNNTGMSEELSAFNGGGAVAAEKIQDIIGDIPIAKMLISFLFYFLGGYLLYGALLAAVGSAVDNEADTQQFMLPITVPLIFSFIIAQTVMENPDGPMAFWLSIFPLTSPIIMMVRIPFGVDVWEIVLSIVLLIGGFIGTTWIAAKIYRTGILMYGKKITYKELFKWLKYKG